ncbi:MAG TPA: DinB family protein [Planctomycetota bacterium]|nr:DinB family protein [Planctomycetota bacterium]
MPLRDLLLPEWDAECASTRRVLDRLPEDRYAWKPHAKSTPASELAGHLVDLAGFAELTLTRDALDLAPQGAPPFQEMQPRNRAELLARFDAARDATHAALAGTDDDGLRQPWSLLLGGKVFRSWTRYSALRGFVMNHSVHHRAQLAVYLRLMDVAVPSIYGPTADEPHT